MITTDRGVRFFRVTAGGWSYYLYVIPRTRWQRWALKRRGYRELRGPFLMGQGGYWVHDRDRQVSSRERWQLSRFRTPATKS